MRAQIVSIVQSSQTCKLGRGISKPNTLSASLWGFGAVVKVIVVITLHIFSLHNLSLSIISGREVVSIALLITFVYLTCLFLYKPYAKKTKTKSHSDEITEKIRRR